MEETTQQSEAGWSKAAPMHIPAPNSRATTQYRLWISRRISIWSLVIIVMLACSFPGKAWVYPEHRDIALLAIKNLDPQRRAMLDQLWEQARKGHEPRLNQAIIDPTQGIHPKFLDYAAWPAIGGDHSTSPVNMLHNILETEWIMGVAHVAAQLKDGIARSKNKSELNNHLRNSDIRLLRVDPEYVTRAGANNSHFMMALPSVNTSAKAYGLACSETGCAPNSLGTYMWYHISAMNKARRLASEDLTPDRRSELALSTLADEAFAIHFLEDCFAAGHVAGCWGNASERKGSHDYYDEKGIEVTTWDGEKLVLMGDAFIRPQDAERAAKTVQMSMEQILDIAGHQSSFILNDTEITPSGPDTFNIAKAIRMPERKVDPSYNEPLGLVLIHTPVPGLAAGPGELPRIRSEIGAFSGLLAAGRSSTFDGGFGTSQNTAGVNAGFEMAFRLGLGMEGVLNESGDGLIFLDAGWRLDGPSSMKFSDNPALLQYQALSAAIPSRGGPTFRLRLPFWLLPGDLLIAGPILFLVSKKSLAKMAVTAANGGLIPWHSAISSGIGRFQFVLGREVGVTFFGATRSGSDGFYMPVTGQTSTAIVTMPSTQFDFPILEYTPFHYFSSNQTGSLKFQINGGVDFPGGVTVVTPKNAPVPEVKTIWFLGLRMAFDWRHYY